MPSFSLEVGRIFAGPNVLIAAKAIRWRLKSPEFRAWESPAAVLAFAAPLFPLLPRLRGHLESVLAQRQTSPTLAEFLMYLAMELQSHGRHPARLARARPGPGDNAFDVVCEYRDEAVARIAMETAAQLTRALFGPDGANYRSPEQIMESFARRVELRGLDQTTRAIIQAAEARGIPWFRLDPSARIVQLGRGRFARRIFESMIDSDGQIAARFIAAHKNMTNHVLRRAGLPAPRQAVVTSAAGAVRAAAGIGFPVVLKPLDSGKGRGVIIGLRSREEVGRAFERGFKPGTQVVVERFIPGHDHRLLVVGGKLIAAARRIPGGVTGDGKSTIRQLVDKTNADPRRGLRFTNLLVRLELDQIARSLLAGQGLDENSVPQAGRRVALRRTANISTGGTAVDVTDRVHPENRRMAELAARVVGLQVAGIDFITPDIARPYHEAGGICEVNNTPGLRPHWVAEGGERRDVVSPILNRLFPPGRPHHVPLAAITGTNGKTTTCFMLAHILRQVGRSVGLVSTLGISVDGEYLRKGDLAGPNGFEVVARHPSVDAIVTEVPRGGLISRGLGFQTCDVSAVLNVTTDHLGERGVETLEDMARVKGIVAAAATRTVVLNADDPRCLAMAEGAKAAQVCLVSIEADSPALASHLAAGGRGARLTLRDGNARLTLCSGEEETDLLAAAEIPATLGGLALHNVQNALFAAALAQGIGIGVEHIRAALATFRSDYDTLPGRINVYDGLPFKVILDYGHNPDGYRRLGPMVTAMAAGKGRRICVFTSPADRNDAHLQELAAAAAPHFDLFICRQGAQRDGAAADVSAKLRDALIAQGIAEGNILAGQSPRDAIRSGLEMARPGDVVYVMSSQDPGAGFWEVITSFGKEKAAGGTAR